MKTNNTNKKPSVICIFSDEYGFLGVARNYEAALYFLLNQKWISDEVEVYDDDDEVVTIDEYLGNNWFEKQLEWTISDFNAFWVGHFSLSKCPVYSV